MVSGGRAWDKCPAQARYNRRPFRSVGWATSLAAERSRSWPPSTSWPTAKRSFFRPHPHGFAHKKFALPLCEMWHFDSGGRVVGGDLYYDQVSLLAQLGL